MLARDPTDLFERYGRQLLVQGAQFDGQQVLHRMAASLSADASEVATVALEAAARYLVGAGLGRVAVPSAARRGLLDLDPDLQLLDGPADATPPVVHVHFAQEVDGARAELHDVRANGLSRACRLSWRQGGPAGPLDGVSIGAAAAQLIVDDALGLEPLPVSVALDLRDAAQPRRDAVPRPAAPAWLATWSAQHRAELYQLAAAAYPHEACGLLVTDPQGQLHVVPTANLQDAQHRADPAAFPRTSQTAFVLDGRELARQERLGRAVAAIWHSHCDAPAVLSAEDLRWAVPDGQPLYADALQAVVQVQDGRATDLAVYQWCAPACDYVRVG